MRVRDAQFEIGRVRPKGRELISRIPGVQMRTVPALACTSSLQRFQQLLFRLLTLCHSATLPLLQSSTGSSSVCGFCLLFKFTILMHCHLTVDSGVMLLHTEKNYILYVHNKIDIWLKISKKSFFEIVKQFIFFGAQQTVFGFSFRVAACLVYWFYSGYVSATLPVVVHVAAAAAAALGSHLAHAPKWNACLCFRFCGSHHMLIHSVESSAWVFKSHFP